MTAPTGASPLTVSPPSGNGRLRAGLVALALLLAVVAAAVIVASAPTWSRSALGVLTLVGLLSLGAGIRWRNSGAVGGALVCLGVAFVLGQLHDSGVPGLVVVVTPLLFASAELAHWSMDLATPVADEPGVHLSRWIWFLATVGMTVALSAALVRLASVQLGDGVSTAPVAVAAALGLLGITVVLARRGSS